jgi:hypothetical protein
MVSVMGHSEFPREVLRSCKANGMKLGMMKIKNVRKVKVMYAFKHLLYFTYLLITVV